ncbi:hypothetical protein BGZ92_011934 [Podila epicladia]|nr:hypothetical protein BGZ92_011934 [Podila epicladia]
MLRANSGQQSALTHNYNYHYYHQHEQLTHPHFQSDDMAYPPPDQTQTSPPSSSSSSTFSSRSNAISGVLTPLSSSSRPKKFFLTREATLEQHRQEQLDTLEEFQDILSAEVLIEITKLREYSRHGIPKSVRGEAWLFLLGIKDADRSKEISTQKRLQHEYEQMDKEPGEQARRVRGDISRCLRRCAQMRSSRNIPQLLEEIVSAYCNHNRQVEYYPAMVNIAVPIVFAVKQDWNAYACFEQVVNVLDAHFSEERIQESTARFMTMFHGLLPDLYSYFEEEEVNIREWAASALRHLLSRELTVENTLRLWDTYFAQKEDRDKGDKDRGVDRGGEGAEWTDLNTCVCLALLKRLKEEFEEWEQSEICSTLMKLPSLDMDPVRETGDMFIEV